MLPIFFSGLVILTHDAIANDFPSRHDITRDASFFGMWNSCQEVFCSGNILLKVCKKDVLESVNFLSVKERDAASAILFAIPSICTVDRGDVLFMCCLSANALRRCPAIVDVAVLCFCVQATVDMLSQKRPMWAPWMDSGMICSSTSHPISNPAISRSLMDMVPLRLLDEMNLSWMTCGHSNLQTHW